MIWLLRILAALIAAAEVHMIFRGHETHEPKDVDHRVNTLTFAFTVVILLLHFHVGCS